MIRVLQVAHMLLALPEEGMPQILGLVRGPGKATLSSAAILATVAKRTSGMDVPPPPASLLPVGGQGCFDWPAIQGHRQGRQWICEFQNWTVAEQNGETILSAADRRTEVALTIRLRHSSADVLMMSTEFKNIGSTPYQLDRCMAASMLVDADQLISFEGMWSREFQRRDDTLGAGTWLQESRRGRTSHDRSPTVFLHGRSGVHGLHLGWSGNHVIVIDRLVDGRRLVHAGELFEPGEMQLTPGESYVSPVGHMAYSRLCLDDVRDKFHAHVRDCVLNWPQDRISPRPVTLNTWEGNYFKHDVGHLKAQAIEAAKLGVERFVLDDGWFGRRDSDRTSLGDWMVDGRKYPDGLGPLIDCVQAQGMSFGLWFEPEMINEDSDLYRAHPDWVLQMEGHANRPSRGQLVLDLTRPEAFEHIYEQMHAILSRYPISYIKWDMNRDLTAAGGKLGHACTSAQTRAVYAMMDRLRAAHPNLEIESCASGGGRIDYGVLARSHRVWLSDCTDALDRLDTQAGASLFLPPEIVGCHISASPNHQTHRHHSLAFRAIVAMDGHFGIELNPLELSHAEREELRDWIALHKRLRPLLHGPGQRFRHAVVDGRHIHGVIRENKIIIIVAQALHMVNEQPAPIQIHDLPLGRLWRVSAVHPAKPEYILTNELQRQIFAGDVPFSSDELSAVGLPLPKLRPQSGVIIELIAGDLSHG